MWDIHGISDSEYIFYADESGDHSLTSIDKDYPIFALSLCGFKKTTYCSRVVPAFQRFKFKYFGHDAVVLHEHEIRKQREQFRILTQSSIRKGFMEDLSNIIASTPFRIFSTVIAKDRLKLDLFPENPYSISLKVCLQNAFAYLSTRNQENHRTHFIFEKRGKKEDKELELEFLRLKNGQNDLGEPMPNFELHFADKKTNSTGMQIADLTARPIGLSVLKPNQTNFAFDLISRKIFRRKKFASPSRGIYIP